jgi:hypothetical protein
MQSATATSSCAAINPHCKSVCSGYGTQPDCPPLIVLAVLSTQCPDPKQKAQASAEGGKAKALLRWLRARFVAWMHKYDDESLEDWANRNSW